ESEVTSDANDGYTVTNTEIDEPTPPETTEVSVEKVWEGDALDSVTIDLLADGEKAHSVVLSEEGDWKYVFTDLPKENDAGDEIEYSVVEEDLDNDESEETGDAK